MLCRAGSGHRHLFGAFASRHVLSFSFRCFSSPARSRPISSFQELPGVSPAEDPQFRFTGKVSRALLSKFPKDTAAFLAVLEKLSATNMSRDGVLVALEALPHGSDTLSNKKKTCAFAQELVQAALPDRAMHVLNIAHQVGLVLKHNQYEQVAYQLALRHYWKHLGILTTMSHRMTGSWSVRLLNWALRSYIETQNYSLLDAALTEFEHSHLKPTRLSYHLLIEGHLRNSNLSRARDCLVLMQTSGFDMDESTYIVVLNAYRPLGLNNTVEAQAFQALQGTGSASDTMILNGIMKLRIDTGDVAGALRVLNLFTLFPTSDFSEHGEINAGDRQNHVYPSTGSISSSGYMVINAGDRQKYGMSSCVPDHGTFNILLMLLAHHQGQLDNVLRVFRQMTSTGHPIDAETVTALVSAYTTANMTGTALSLVYGMCKRHHIPVDRNEFHRLGRLTDTFEAGLDLTLSVCPNTNVFNALLRAVLPEKGLVGMRRLLRIMRRASLVPDASTIQIILTHLHDTHHMTPRSLIKVLETLTRFGAYEGSLTVQHLNIILRSLLRQELNILRTNSWNASAQRVRFGHMARFSRRRLSNDTRNFDPTAGISPDSFQKRISKVFKPIVRTLVERQVMSDRMTFALRIRRDALVKLDMESAQRAFDIMIARGIRANEYHYSALIEGYAALGRMADARTVVERASLAGIEPTVIMYTILINGFGRLGKPALAHQTFTEMVARGVKPDIASVDAVVSAYWFVKAYMTARKLLLDLWPLVSPFPPELHGAPLRVLIQSLRAYRAKSQSQSKVSLDARQERRRRIAVRRAMARTLSELKQWQQVEEALSWAKADIGLGDMLHTNTSKAEQNYDWL